jgi:hypothetical protein
MAWLEGSALGHVMRESGVWTYGIVNLVHILGVCCLFGSVLILDLRLIGPLAERSAFRPFRSRLFPSPLWGLLSQQQAEFVCLQPTPPNTPAIHSCTLNFLQ